MTPLLSHALLQEPEEPRLRTHGAGSSFYGAGTQAGHNWQPITADFRKRLKNPAGPESPVSAEGVLVQKIQHFKGCFFQEN